MSHTSALSGATRQQIVDAALIDIQKAARGDTLLSLTRESQHLANGHPELAQKEIRELVATLAVASGVNIAFD